MSFYLPFGETIINPEKQRLNEQITVPQVRLLGEESEAFGVVSIEEARRIAAEKGMDLVEVAPEALPPVCRLMDLGKHKYRQKKRLHEQRKHQHAVELKEIWLRPRIDVHDLEVKINHAKDFLNQGFRVALTMRFRAREMLHMEIGARVLQQVGEKLQDFGRLENVSTGDAKRMQVVVTPVKRKGRSSSKGEQSNAEN